jgi:hypothetical protein
VMDCCQQSSLPARSHASVGESEKFFLNSSDLLFADRYMGKIKNHCID